MNNMAEDELDKILGECFGMWLVNDGVEWLDTNEWHIGDGVDDCSGTDGVAQLESYKKAKAAINVYTTNKIIEARLNELDYIDPDATVTVATGGIVSEMTVRDRIAELQKALNHRKDD